MSTEAQVFIRNRSGHTLPAYATPSSAGMDVRAKLETPIVLQPGSYQLIPTGLFAALPAGTELQVRPRSGLAFKHGITVLNAPGTIDADYRGEIGVLLINHGTQPFTIENGERIAQLILAKYERIAWTESENLPESQRGSGGVGSTGTH
ncbi:MAG: dUTP diphosphatase [Crocinitomicaceae bacterium]|nr:dUTP diphosphatase [Crocinitomicaceae bacterium]